MAEINVYEQYFEAEHVLNDVPRRAALVMAPGFLVHGVSDP